jgi:hypothetical protein
MSGSQPAKAEAPQPPEAEAASKAEATAKAKAPPKAEAAPKAKAPPEAEAARKGAGRPWNSEFTWGPAFQRPPRRNPPWHHDLKGGKGRSGGSRDARGSGFFSPAARPIGRAIVAQRPSGPTGGKGTHSATTAGAPFGTPPTRR